MADTLVVPDQALLALMRQWSFWQNSFQQITARLFQNDVTPDADTLLEDLEEADFPGYAAQNITWADPTLVLGRAQLSGTGLTFSRDETGTPQTIYGFYARGVTFSYDQLVWAVRFETPVVMEHDGDFIDLTPRLSLGPFTA